MKFLLASVICALFTGVLYAQSNDSPAIQISIYAFEHAKEHHKIYLETSDGKPYEIALSKANILGPFKTLRDEDGAVSLRMQKTNKDGIMVYPTLAKVKIKANVKEPLLILVPVSGGKTYRAFVVDQSLNSFPKGSYQLINFSPNRIRGLIGDTRIQVAPRKAINFKPSSKAEGLLDVHFQYTNQKEWKTFGRTRWVKKLEKRSLLCTYIDPKNKRMKIRAINLQSIRPLRDRFKSLSQ